MANSAPGILNWSAASSLLQLNPASEVLPTRAECPQCRKPGLLVYCTTVRESWHCCEECNFSGNLLDLCAAGWKLGKLETLQTLTSHKLLTATEETRLLNNWERYEKRRLRHEKLWRMASRAQGLTQRYLHNYCNMNATVSPASWPETLGRICGALPGYSFQLSSVRKLKGSIRPITSLIMPFYSRPRQLCGFLALRDKPSALDPTYTATGGDTVSFHSVYRSCGFLALDTVLQSRSQRIIVLAEPLRALSMHIRHSATSKVPLPVTSTFWDEKQRVRSRETDWHALADRDVYHVCFEFTSRTLAAASWSGGKVLHAPVENPKAKHHWFSSRKPMELVQYIYDNAELWPEVFAKAAAKIDDIELLKLWNEATIHGLSRDCLRELPPKLSQRIARLLDGTNGARSYPIARACYIFKRNSQFHVRMLKKRVEDEYLILDADVRVRTLEQTTGGDFICRGELIHRGQSAEFIVKLKEWETDFAKWLRAFTVKHRMGYVYYAPAWNDRIVRVIMAYHPPYQATRRAARQEAAEASSSSCGVDTAPISPLVEDQGEVARASQAASLEESIQIEATTE